MSTVAMNAVWRKQACCKCALMNDSRIASVFRQSVKVKSSKQGRRFHLVTFILHTLLRKYYLLILNVEQMPNAKISSDWSSDLLKMTHDTVSYLDLNKLGFIMCWGFIFITFHLLDFYIPNSKVRKKTWWSVMSEK